MFLSLQAAGHTLRRPPHLGLLLGGEISERAALVAAACGLVKFKHFAKAIETCFCPGLVPFLACGVRAFAFCSGSERCRIWGQE